jgi:predicted RecA/RadA family phage recombinase
VIDADGSEATWRLGVPNNGQETQAHSPPNAWGSNLDGGPIGLVQTFLVSPAIYVTGGNVATLRFWHSYDFTEQQDDFPHAGQLLIVTNAVSAPITLGVFQDVFSAGWEQAQYDLTPYLGHVVFLVWEYDLISLNFEDQFPRAGWLVDDISVTVNTVTNTAPGEIVITNNLSQAAFTLSGPVNQSGAGLGLALTNVPAGQYVVAWSAVPYYQTPSPQTNAVASGAAVVFQGNYTFVDANTNGMSDAWEQQVFGSVSSGRTQATDTDGDSQTDYAEFIAGTNPNDGASTFEVPPPQPESNGSVRLEWPAVAGRSYRVVSSTDLISWAPASDWIRANGSTVSLVLPSQTGSKSYFYRVEVRP